MYVRVEEKIKPGVTTENADCYCHSGKGRGSPLTMDLHANSLVICGSEE
jgi:hypothetical protein